MKRWLMMLLIAGTASACPAHPGYILNGAVAQISGLQVICGQIYTAFKSGYTGSAAKWVELYAIKNSANPTELARKMSSTFAGVGFTQAQDKSLSSTKRVYGYVNTSTHKIISMYVFVVGSVVYMSLSGN